MQLKSLLTLAAAAAISALAVPAHAQTAAKELFGRVPLPSVSEPQAHGFYSKGCISGAVAMPVDGPTWQAMRLERNRRWGHPKMIALLQRLSREAVQDGWPGLLVGDISQPRGGPMLSGHASHQVGLDADVWLTPMPDRRLSVSERANMSAVSVLKKDSLHVDPRKWTPAHARLLKRAASYPEVQRIFIHPGIKKAMCDTYGEERANDPWMNKLRPYYGHHYHFHIRLFCPEGSPGCKPQQSTGSGNGCDKSLDWWFTSEPWAPKKPKPGAKPAKPRVVTLADLPAACARVLGEPAPADESLVTFDSGYDPRLARSTAVPVEPPRVAASRLPPIVPVPARRPE
ncbi:penicillin-insensitive murein endopeptidase [Oricola thermophila]|uniref:Penicillin-insensitive murein endopeptidase n=1 Tax=Oricola thermophila TaxID=2742145 RepID=A0A6N1VJ60_9HYPH|nr:penicillin-insensitive murein endopeptidase [Oricola thermophila]QKV19775.1 penicillin-insensitive murein endopeptidase [Oricola thermophila]